MTIPGEPVHRTDNGFTEPDGGFPETSAQLVEEIVIVEKIVEVPEPTSTPVDSVPTEVPPVDSGPVIDPAPSAAEPGPADIPPPPEVPVPTEGTPAATGEPVEADPAPEAPAPTTDAPAVTEPSP